MPGIVTKVRIDVALNGTKTSGLNLLLKFPHHPKRQLILSRKPLLQPNEAILGLHLGVLARC